ncbi:GNAT family N-acetyltransferase [Mucilaginibacter sp. OK283]|jgi:GNAT superfamily N-acetyltransferase|uniref:GNAT family N-acetyltransferase n=1 Tax=Mucilaginibacter sp. OK283 TaxID=1881049 RepID=UPI0008BD252A|nr:GNAT family N-acetyltransferase [Mucilaginibacter sp. OK283]SEP18635.1 N-acetylglutamate synthase, GNAT family [Mucilaginibacter sp. OK283]
MLIRLATFNDIPFIMQLIAGVIPGMIASGNLQWDNAYPNTGVFTDDIAQGCLWVAEIDSLIAGVAAITTNQEPEYAQAGWDITETAIVTHRLAVLPRYRGRGIAAALLQQAELEAISRGIKTLRIDTNMHNQATQKLFPKLGYIFAGEINLGFRPGLTFYCYEKRLD